MDKSIEVPSSKTNSGFSAAFFNQTTMHIIAEMIVLVGIVVYFFKKTSKLTKQVQDLTTRLDEQEEMITNHDEVLKKIVANLNYKQADATATVSTPPKKSQNVPRQSVRTPKQPSAPDVTFQPMSAPMSASMSAPINNLMEIFGSVMSAGGMSGKPPATSGSFIEEVNEEGNEENLDSELQEELKELK